MVFDTHLFALTALVTVGMQLAFFFVAAKCKFDTLTDFAGGLNFMALAVLSLVVGGHYHTRQLVASGIVLVCRAELGLFLLFRVCKRGKDARFDEIREDFFRFLGFWVFQMIWVWGVSMAFVFLNTEKTDPDWSAADSAGATVAIVGFLLQFVSDVQKYRFRADPANRGKFCNVGLWKLSRHPNFFGEIMIWWGVFVMASPVFSTSNEGFGWVTIISPILTMLILLFLSGMPTAEGQVLSRYMKTPESKAAYLTYRNRTPILIPFIPVLYAVLPRWFKILFCFEFPMYEYKEPAAAAEPLRPGQPQGTGGGGGTASPAPAPPGAGPMV